MYDDRDKVWTTDGEPTCPYCEELLYFNGITDDITLDVGQVLINWDAHCPRCGREFKVRERYLLNHAKIFEKNKNRG